MATIQEFYKQITDRYRTEAANAGVTIVDPDNWSLVGGKRIWAQTQAFCLWLFQSNINTMIAQTDKKLDEQRKWKIAEYKRMGLAYQHGRSLVGEEDYYDNTGLTPAEIEAQKVIKKCEPVEPEGPQGGIVLKIATIDNGSLAAVPDDIKTPFAQYMKKVCPAGVPRTIITGAADSLKLEIICQIDPLVLNEEGKRIDGTNDTPVQDAIDYYLATDELMPFNGNFVAEHLERYIMDNVQGVKNFHIKQIQTRYGAQPFVYKDYGFNPHYGYIKIYDRNTDLTITWQ
mgnify:CR=1 FL=1